MATLAAASTPEITADNRPALITLALPETGAATKSLPRSFRRSRMDADSSTEMVEQSTTTGGTLPAEATPSLPKMTLSRSLPVETMENTTSQPARSLSLSTILPPEAASGSALARVRFQIDTS